MRYRTWEHLSAITDLTFGFDHGPKRSLGSGHEDRQPSCYGMSCGFVTAFCPGPTVEAFVDVLRRPCPSEG